MSQNILINGGKKFKKKFILKLKRLDYLNSTFKSWVTYHPSYDGGQCHH
jgi:hypothetical protein